jgi:quinol monooxygenase YgiN
MLIRIVRMTFQPDKTEEFRQIFEESKHLIRAREGCLYLELWQDIQQPHVFVTHSHWTSEEALNAYRDSELFRTTWQKTKALFADRAQAFSVTSVDTV